MKTVRVRIAVAVDKSGQWCAVGWDRKGWDEAEEQMRFDIENLHGALDPMPAFHWVEADVPIPEEAIIEGEVQPA